jgi:hypothetical protein
VDIITKEFHATNLHPVSFQPSHIRFVFIFVPVQKMFGGFEFICKTTTLPTCSLVGPFGSETVPFLTTGVLPQCYSRTIDLANTTIFAVGTCFIHIGALLVLTLIIFNILPKITAMGRSEILHFIAFYLLLTLVSLVIDSGVTPPGSPAFPYMVSVQNGLTSAVCSCVMFVGLVAFNLYEDGTPRAIWILRISCLAAFALSFVFSLLTYRDMVPNVFSTTSTLALFVVLYLLNAVFLIVYVITQLITSLVILRDKWSVGAIVLECFFFVAGQVLLYAFSNMICNQVKHYIDGGFFATVCNLFAVMMVYKYWDMVTREDLEFSVSNVDNSWDIKEILDDDRYDGNSEYAASTYALNHGFYDGQEPR